MVEEKSGEKLELTTDNLPPLPVVTMRKCTDCEIVIAPGVAAVKLMIEGCSNTTVSLDGKVLTETLEVWGCNSCTVKVSSPIKTVQVDACQGLALQYERASDFDRCLSAGAFQVSLTFADSLALNGTVDLAELRAQMPGKGFSAETDQFITRHVDGALLTELIIRLSNDFPTTEREVPAQSHGSVRNGPSRVPHCKEALSLLARRALIVCTPLSLSGLRICVQDADAKGQA